MRCSANSRKLLRHPILQVNSAEASQLFSLIDRDGSGSIDLAEFTQLMRSVPLQQPLGKTLVGATVGMMRSLVTLDASLAGKLRGEQLAKAGHVIIKLREAGWP